MNFKKRILCIGAGYVGGPTMAIIADKCPDYRVEVVDVNAERIAAWQSADLPIYEPGLDEIVFRNRGKNLFFSTDIEQGIRDSDIIFVSVNTPTKTYGQGAGSAADVQYVEKVARTILACSTSDKIVIEKSTVPVRTAEVMGRILRSGSGNVNFAVLSNPEFLAEGTAVEDLLHPDRVLIGAHDTETGKVALETLAEIYGHWVPADRVVRSNVWSSELAKLVANAFLAQRVSSINSISALCEQTEADVQQVAHAIGLDPRIGSRFLQAGVGFGGSCFRKDILNLAYICGTYGLEAEANYWHQVVTMNDHQQDRFVSNLITALFNTVAGKDIAVFGFAFKADTGDTRDSPAIRVCKQLREEHARLRITDPKAIGNAKLEIPESDEVAYIEDPYEAARGAHALAIMTDWKEYKDLDYERIYQSMEKPATLFDGRNLLDRSALFEIGFNVYSVGRAPLTHF